MTYPPPPYGQPDGFPPRPGGHPQSDPQSGPFPGAGGYPGAGPASQPAGFPQPPAGAPGYGQYPGYEQPGGYGAFGWSPPPSKSRKGLWIGLTAGLVVILAAVGVTGFWQPGFFLGKSSSTATPEAALQGIVDGLNKQDEAALTALTCANADPKIATAISNVAGVTDAKLVSGPTKVSENEYDGVISITYNGKPSPFTGKLAKENGNWCWQDAADEKST